MSAFVAWTWASATGQEIGPGMFSGFHFLCLGLMVALCVGVCLLFARKHDPKTDRIVVGVFAIIMLCGEIFKQLFWYEYYQYYRWEIFPYQFCSVPIYVSLFATFVPWEKVREVCYRFLAFFGIIGGLAVMLVPSAVLYTYFVPISIHSMVWHSVLTAMGVYLIVSRGYGKEIKELFQPFCMFLGCVVLAIVGNLLVYNLHLKFVPVVEGGDRLSMFYISPYYPTELPLLGIIQEFSYPLFVLSYIALFTSFTLIVWGITKGIRTLSRKKVKA